MKFKQVLITDLSKSPIKKMDNCKVEGNAERVVISCIGQSHPTELKDCRFIGFGKDSITLIGIGEITDNDFYITLLK